jgi:hypothetical protein
MIINLTTTGNWQLAAGGAVFGISLNELMTTRENDREVPFIMEKTISWLIDNNATHVEGLFRISGMMTEMQHYRNMCDQVRLLLLPIFLPQNYRARPSPRHFFSLHIRS